MLDYENVPEDVARKASKDKHYFNKGFVNLMVPRGVKFDLHEKIIKPRLNLNRYKRVVEIGVGKMSHLGSYSDCDYHAFDIDQECVDQSRLMAGYFGVKKDNIRKRRSDKLPFLDSSIDGIFSVCTLHEIEDIESELTEMDRLTKPGGNIIIVERMCALSETPEEIERLRSIPRNLDHWFN